MSDGQLAKSLTTDISGLLVALAFIVLGINAFTEAGGFESTVNSILPVAAGASVVTINKSQTENDKQELEEALEKSLNGISELE